ncbi:hypothetical protein Tco_1219178 [Tanacetum coccineum]
MEEVIVPTPVQERLDMEVDKVKGAIESADQKMMVISLAATVDGKSSISSTNALDLTASQDICSRVATADQKIIASAVVVDGNSSITNTNTPEFVDEQQVVAQWVAVLVPLYRETRVD